MILHEILLPFLNGLATYILDKVQKWVCRTVGPTLAIVGRGFLTPLILWRPPYIPYILPILSDPLLPWCLQPPLLFLLPCFVGWMGNHTTFDALLNDIVDLNMSNFDALAPEGPCCVFCASRCQVYWVLTHLVFCWYSDLISRTHT